VSQLRKLGSPVLEELAGQLRYAPAEAARRHVERAEKLAAIVEPGNVYPQDWIAQQLTGYRPERGGDGLVPGEQLLADLGPLVEMLCVRAAYTPAELAEPEWIGIDAVCARWKISRRTLERYRRAGLLSRRVRVAGGRGKAAWGVVFDAKRAEQFAAAQAGRIAGAAARKRLSRDERQALVGAAGALVQQGSSRTAAAREVAGSVAQVGTGRVPSVATVLRLTRDRAVGAAGPESPEHQGAVAWRAMRMGLAAAEIGRRWRKSAASVRRAADVHVLRELLAMEVDAPAGPKFDARDATERFLQQPFVQTGLGEPAEASVAAFVATALEQGRGELPAEKQRASAACWLLWRAMQRLGQVDRTDPDAMALDAVLSDLLYVSRLRAELLRGQRVQLLETVRAVTGAELAELEPHLAVRLTDAAMAAGAEAVGRYDPLKGGRVAAPVGLAFNRVVARLWNEHVNMPLSRPVDPAASRRARSLAQPAGPPPLQDWTRRIDPWQWLVEADARVFSGVPALKPAWRTLLARRLGLGRYGGNGPMSLADLAAEMKVRPDTVLRSVRAALRAAVEAGRAG
jgi:hypothetical protein